MEETQTSLLVDIYQYLERNKKLGKQKDGVRRNDTVEDTSKIVSSDVSNHVSIIANDDVSNDLSNDVSDGVSNGVSIVVSNDVSNDVKNDVSDITSNDFLNIVKNDLSNLVRNDVSNNVSNHASNIVNNVSNDVETIDGNGSRFVVSQVNDECYDVEGRDLIASQA